MEVKPNGRPNAELRNDLRKLTWFCRNARYHRGIFLVYGGMGEGAIEELTRRLRMIAEPDGNIDLTLTRVLSHRDAGERATRVNL